MYCAKFVGFLGLFLLFLKILMMGGCVVIFIWHFTCILSSWETLTGTETWPKLKYKCLKLLWVSEKFQKM